MAGFFGRLFGKKPKAPKVTAARGHRGIAAGNLRARHEAEQRYRETGGYDPATGEQVPPPYSQEEIDAWRTVSADEVGDYINLGVPLFVHSSNVEFFQYEIAEQKLIVGFLGGARYIYDNVSPTEAMEAATAQSKGGFVWSRLRQRGSATGHQKPYHRL